MTHLESSEETNILDFETYVSRELDPEYFVFAPIWLGDDRIETLAEYSQLDIHTTKNYDVIFRAPPEDHVDSHHPISYAWARDHTIPAIVEETPDHLTSSGSAYFATDGWFDSRRRTLRDEVDEEEILHATEDAISEFFQEIETTLLHDPETDKEYHIVKGSL